LAAIFRPQKFGGAIAANTAIFSLIDAVMLRSLPVRDPQRLVLLHWSAQPFRGLTSYA
jgi:hypothetical protein